MNLNELLPPTTKRVEMYTKAWTNTAIRQKTLARLDAISHENLANINQRIQDSNIEWDIEKVLSSNTSSIVLIASILGLKSNKKWFLFTGTIGFLLMQHSLHNWSPPLPYFRLRHKSTVEKVSQELNEPKLITEFARDATTEELLHWAELN